MKNTTIAEAFQKWLSYQLIFFWLMFHSHLQCFSVSKTSSLFPLEIDLPPPEYWYKRESNGKAALSWTLRDRWTVVKEGVMDAQWRLVSWIYNLVDDIVQCYLWHAGDLVWNPQVHLLCSGLENVQKMDQILTLLTRKAGDGLLTEVLALERPGIFLSLTGSNWTKLLRS